MSIAPRLRFALLSCTAVLLAAGLMVCCGPNGTSRPFEVRAIAPTTTLEGASAVHARREAGEHYAALAEQRRIAAAEAARLAAQKAEEARIARERASRAKRPVVVAQAAPAAPAPEPGSCDAWGYKSKAQSDACWGPIIASYGDWPVGRMLAILYCESKGNPWVVNSSNHVGLFQIKNSHTKGDGPGNIAHAHAMWLNSGTAPWRQCGG